MLPSARSVLVALRLTVVVPLASAVVRMALLLPIEPLAVRLTVVALLIVPLRIEPPVLLTVKALPLVLTVPSSMSPVVLLTELAPVETRLGRLVLPSTVMYAPPPLARPFSVLTRVSMALPAPAAPMALLAVRVRAAASILVVLSPSPSSEPPREVSVTLSLPTLILPTVMVRSLVTLRFRPPWSITWLSTRPALLPLPPSVAWNPMLPPSRVGELMP